MFVTRKDLADAKGNILENKELLESLNKTKQSAATIQKSLTESLKLAESLEKVVATEPDLFVLDHQLGNVSRKEKSSCRWPRREANCTSS